MEIIDIQSDDMLKEKFKEVSLLNCRCLPENLYLKVRSFAHSFISVFGTTYICEKTFSKMKYVKSIYMSSFSGEHLKSVLTIGQTNFEPQLNLILAGESQYYSSHQVQEFFQGAAKTVQFSSYL
jgi:hypothetical protein